MKVLSAETNLSSATNVGSASVVRIFNSDSSAATVTKKDSGGSTIGTFTVGAGEVIYCEKNYTDTLEGGATLKVSKTAYSSMMSYSSYSSGGGGGGGDNVVTDNMVVYLDAGNNSSYSGSGTSWNDISGNSNNFTLTNGPTYTSSDGGAIVFDGTNDCAVSALNQSFFQFGTDDYSYGLWVKFDTLGDYEGTLSSGRGNESGTNDYVGSWQIDTVSGVVNHKLGSNAGNITLTSSLNPSIGTWYYIFVVNDRSQNELKLYVNGSLNTTTGQSGYGSISVGNYSNATSIYNIFNIGRNRNQDSYFDGSVGQVHVYKGKALTASEVLQNYDASKSRYGY
jgi:hypothetical protein